ncbi:hypothetical protein [Sphingomonas parva]|nr:hypothetical protein [Sphingomonas parva]
MVNVAPPRFVRSAGPGVPLGQALQQGFALARGGLPRVLQQLIERLNRIT